MVSLMLGTGFVGGADDASTLVKIFSTAALIFKHVLLYSQKKGFFSFSSVAVEQSLRFLFSDLVANLTSSLQQGVHPTILLSNQ
jgi:hypothetical protein